MCHSLTIFGLERRTSGSAELLVFDPMFHDPATIAENVGRKTRFRNPDHALKLYRRGPKYLRKYHEFEILRCVLCHLVSDPLRLYLGPNGAHTYLYYLY
ncbi:hypothetical protein SLS62_000812 [Diatrype stigma]|uniref:UFSP1/2/DUB catalytic domain-containing protein n=1 Tax=Diatrype stigma TaxID=117547 RepID=A0AAN9YSE5_9PEZI